MDYEALYARRATFDGVEPGEDLIPWDIGEPQAAIVELERTGGFEGKVLDVGCGLGENAILLADHGHEVTGVDGSPTAIEQAGNRASAHGVRIRFEVADATRLDNIGDGFATVLDSGLYHCLDNAQRSAYAAALHRITLPDATLHLFCFAESVPSATPIMEEARISPDNLHANLDHHWEILDITETVFATSFTRELLARMRETRAPETESVKVDAHGRVLLPMSHVRARRR
ncbi:class I SAM-dependent methyltransferase [Amycolatopsis sp. NPDC049868]|uniref:class I SAM-dependent methyltransferase n=1 Tax=Amycolatopsis sp. NPDC049868 TaxID=3363934 RepID=UPI0037A2AC4E